MSRIDRATVHLIGEDTLDKDVMIETSEIDRGDFSIVTVFWSAAPPWNEWVAAVYVSDFEPHPNVMWSKEMS